MKKFKELCLVFVMFFVVWFAFGNLPADAAISSYELNKEGVYQIGPEVSGGSAYGRFDLITVEDCQVSFSRDTDVTKEGQFTPTSYYYKQLSAEETYSLTAGETYTCRVSGSAGVTVKVTFGCVHEWDSSTGRCKKCKQACTHVYGERPTPEYCSVCGKKCTHKHLENKKIVGDSGSVHYVYYDCKDCKKVNAVKKSVKHTFGKPYQTAETKRLSEEDDYGNSKHVHCVKCKVCGEEIIKSCSTKSKKYKKISIYANRGYKHIVHYICECGSDYKQSEASHKFNKKNVCTQCGFKRVIPGKLTVTAKQTKKVTKHNYYIKGHWDTTGHWQSALSGTEYYYTVKFTMKKGKNTVGYNIAYKKEDIGNVITTKKNTFTAEEVAYKTKPKSFTLWITPISKTGTKGTTVKKTIRLK